VARAADAPFVFLVESDADASRERGLLFRAPRELIRCRAANEVRACLEAAERARAAGRYVAGFLAYEAGYGLHDKLTALRVPSSTEDCVWLGVFDEQEELRGAQVAAFLAEQRAEPARVTTLRFDRNSVEYARDFERIQAYLHAGDSYQVCQSLRARFQLRGSATALFERLRAAQPTAYSALIDTGEYSIVSVSPELFFRKSGGLVELQPMKGTAAPGKDSAEDARIAERMRQDPKTIAENVMIVDLLRNDIGRLAKPGSVRVPELFAVQRFAQVLQMTSSITARVEPSLGLGQLLESLFPSGSVTGAPKLRTMQIIHELEPTARGIFCGSIGYVTPSNDACFNVAIRSACVDRAGQGVLGVGSGIVVDSRAEAELAECLLKARFLSDAAE
jgi:para-aminobenzoate synthetase / 4-amino-4-deoxychorismate lyase